ncbi:MAG TPA: hypothetical protein VFB62_12585 [Polyangiaceae bacterium]|nr:hypothetical protein [Polyangiaceae bacterium]
MEAEGRLEVRAAVLWLVALAWLFSSVAAAADTLAPAAQKHLNRGIAEYSARHYEAAIRHFRAAYDIDPKPEVLFAWAQAERLSGDCASAITLYRRFLEQNPAAEEEQQAAVHLARCERALATTPTPPPAPAPPPPRRAPRPKTPSKPTESEPWYADALGGVLFAGGIAAAGVGAGLLIVAQLKEGDADGAATYGQYDEQLTEVDRFRIGGAIALGTGAALLVAAVVRYATRGSEVQARAYTLSIAF